MKRATGARRARAATTLAVASAIAAAAAVPVLGLRAADTLANSTTGEVLPGPGTASLPFTPAALLATVDGRGEVVGLTVLALSPTGAGGTVVVVPTGSAVQDAAGVSHRVAESYRTGGREALTAAVENLLGITVSSALDVDPAGLAELLEPYGPFDVTLPDPVVDAGPDGQPVVRWEAGPQELTAAEMAEAMAARRPSQTEIVRLPALAALWDAVVHPSGSVESPIAAPTTAPAEVDTYLGAIRAGEAAVRTLGVEPVLDQATNPDGVDLLATDRVEIVMLMARVLPSAVSPAGAGLRVKVVQATGDARAAHEVTQRLLFVGMSLVMLADAPVQDESVLQFASAEVRERTGDFVGLFGDVRLEQARQPIDGVDFTVVLGSDFLRSVSAEELADSPFETTTTFATTAPAGGGAP